MQTAKVEGQVVKIGDYVGFKCDIEQCGRIERISKTFNNINLHLTNVNGFEGEYIGGEYHTVQDSDDCWIL